MPYLAHIGLESDVPFEYLRSVYSSILLKDTVAREKIRNVHFLEVFVTYLADNIGNLLAIQDNYPKYVVTFNDMILGDNQEGIHHLNMEEFFLQEL